MRTFILVLASVLTACVVDTPPAATDEQAAAPLRDPSTSPSPCTYVDGKVFMLSCGGDYPVGLNWQWDPSGGGSALLCPPYVTLNGNTYASETDAAIGEGCSATCVWHMTDIGDGIWCERHFGYEHFEANGDRRCADLYRYPDGVYPSWEAYLLAHPCNSRVQPPLD